MATLYESIKTLCEERGMTVAKMCTQAGISKGILTDLKMGRKNTLQGKTLSKIADALGVSVDRILGNSPASLTREDLKIALFGGAGEISDEMLEEVCRFAAYVKQREANKEHQ